MRLVEMVASGSYKIYILIRSVCIVRHLHPIQTDEHKKKSISNHPKMWDGVDGNTKNLWEPVCCMDGIRISRSLHGENRVRYTDFKRRVISFFPSFPSVIKVHNCMSYTYTSIQHPMWNIFLGTQYLIVIICRLLKFTPFS